MSIPRSMCLSDSEGWSAADGEQRVGQGGNFHGNFSGNNESTRASTAPSAVGVLFVIGIMFPPTGLAPAPAPAHPSSETLSPDDAGGPLEDVPGDVVPSDAQPADTDGGAGTDKTDPIGSVGGGEIALTTTPGGGGDSQNPGQSPTPAGGDPGKLPDLRPHLVPVVNGGAQSSPGHFFWLVAFRVSCGLLIALAVTMLCKCLCSPGEDEDKGKVNSEGPESRKQPASKSTDRETTKDKEIIRKGCTNV